MHDHGLRSGSFSYLPSFTGMELIRRLPKLHNSSLYRTLYWILVLCHILGSSTVLSRRLRSHSDEQLLDFLKESEQNLLAQLISLQSEESRPSFDEIKPALPVSPLSSLEDGGKRKLNNEGQRPLGRHYPNKLRANRKDLPFGSRLRNEQRGTNSHHTSHGTEGNDAEFSSYMNVPKLRTIPKPQRFKDHQEHVPPPPDHNQEQRYELTSHHPTPIHTVSHVNSGVHADNIRPYHARNPPVYHHEPPDKQLDKLNVPVHYEEVPQAPVRHPGTTRYHVNKEPTVYRVEQQTRLYREPRPVPQHHSSLHNPEPERYVYVSQPQDISGHYKPSATPPGFYHPSYTEKYQEPRPQQYHEPRPQQYHEPRPQQHHDQVAKPKEPYAHHFLVLPGNRPDHQSPFSTHSQDPTHYHLTPERPRHTHHSRPHTTAQYYQENPVSVTPANIQTPHHDVQYQPVSYTPAVHNLEQNYHQTHHPQQHDQPHEQPHVDITHSKPDQHQSLQQLISDSQFNSYFPSDTTRKFPQQNEQIPTYSNPVEEQFSFPLSEGGQRVKEAPPMYRYENGQYVRNYPPPRKPHDHVAYPSEPTPASKQYPEFSSLKEAFEGELFRQESSDAKFFDQKFKQEFDKMTKQLAEVQRY